MDKLDVIAKLVLPYNKVADIGCDHGYLLKKLNELNNLELGYAIDNKIGPLESAKSNLKDYSNIIYHLSSGLDKVDDRIECIVISGMGGLLIIDIINNNIKKAKKLKRIITSANRNNYELRSFLVNNGFIIENEANIIIDNHYYEIDSWTYKGEVITYNDIELYFGPIIVKEKNDNFISYLNMLYNNLSIVNYEKLSDDKRKLLKYIEGVLCL